MRGISDLLATPSEHNIMWFWITSLIPLDSVSPYSVAVGTLAASMTFLVSLVVAYQVVIGIVSSAYSGKVLGDKYHQIWAPLRVVWGFGLLIPIAGGFTAGHYLLRDIPARIGINLVDTTWVSYVDSVAYKKMQITPATTGGSTLVLDVLEHEICVAVHNRIAGDMGTVALLPIPPVRGTESGERRGWWNPETVISRVEWNYGPDCGSFSYPMVADASAFMNARRLAVGEILEAVRGSVDGYAELFARQHWTASASVADALIREGKLPELAIGIRTMGAAYDKAIADAAGIELNSDEEVLENGRKLVAAARQQGFINAGAYYTNLSNTSQRLSALTGEEHSRTGIRFGDGTSSAQDHIQAALATLRYHIAGEETAVGLTANDLAGSGDASSDILTKIYAPIQRRLGEWLYTKGDANLSVVERVKRLDPMGDMISSGHFFMNVSGGAIGAATVAIVAAWSAPGKLAGLDGAALWAMGWASPGLIALWVIGAIRAYVIPNLAFIMVFMLGARVLLGYLEASIAVLMWGFACIKMDGQDLIDQQQRTGVMALFHIMLTPTIGILAYCATFILLPLIIGTMEVLWPSAFYGQTGGYMVSLGAMLVYLVLSTWFSVWLTMNLLGSVFGMPDRVMAWFGVPSGTSLTDKADFTAAMMAANAILNTARPPIPTSLPGQNGDGDKGGNGGAGKQLGSAQNGIAIKK